MLVDTGPITALLARDDPYHGVCRRIIRGSRNPLLLTCWPVITEAAWLLRGYKNAVKSLLGYIDQDLLRMLELDERAPRWLAAFLEQYADLRPQLADAALVYLAEREGIETVFTLDRRDFTVYRTSGNKLLRLVPEALP